MPKGTRYELLIYASRHIDGGDDYRIVSTKPFPAFIIGQAFKSYALEQRDAPSDGMEYRIRDIEIVHLSRADEPHVWQTKLRLVEVARRKVLPIPMDRPVTEEFMMRRVEADGKHTPESSLIRAQWDHIERLQGD